MEHETTNRFLLPPISPAKAGTLYQQIVDGIKREISEGRLTPGAPLPSFRVLAEDLLVSLITVKRAYEELEREGIIFRKQGLGTFVSDQGALRSRAGKRVETEALLRRAVREGRESGMTDGELEILMRQVLQEPGEE
jgi:GntR family transcriptional regulator